MKRHFYILVLLIIQKSFSQDNKNYRYEFGLEDYPSRYQIEPKANVRASDINYNGDPISDVIITVYDSVNNILVSERSDINGEIKRKLKRGKYFIDIQHVQFSKIKIFDIIIQKFKSYVIKVELGYAWQKTLDGVGTINSKVMLTKEDIKDILELIGRGKKIEEINNKKFTISWQL